MSEKSWLDPTRWFIKKDDDRNVVRVALFIFYAGTVIGAIDDRGKIVWRDERYPLFLVEYLIKETDHNYKMN